MACLRYWSSIVSALAEHSRPQSGEEAPAKLLQMPEVIKDLAMIETIRVKHTRSRWIFKVEKPNVVSTTFWQDLSL